jgi:hypothetical protein
MALLIKPIYDVDSSVMGLGELSATDTAEIIGPLAVESDSRFNSTGALKISVGTSAERPAAAEIGMTRVNSEDGIFEYFNGVTWRAATSVDVVTGGVVVQSGSKSAEVTLDTNSGQITMSDEALLPAAIAGDRPMRFKLNSSKIKVNDCVAVNVKSNATGGAYIVWADEIATGSCYINLRNTGAWTLSEAINLQFSVVPGKVETGNTAAQGANKYDPIVLEVENGEITMSAASMPPAAIAGDRPVRFLLTNSLLSANDCLAVHHKSGGTPGAYTVWADQFGGGSCYINIRNISATALAEAIVIQFAIVKGAIQ